MDLVTRKAGSLTTRGPTRTSPSSTNFAASLTDGAIFSRTSTTGRRRRQKHDTVTFSAFASDDSESTRPMA